MDHDLARDRLNDILKKDENLEQKEIEKRRDAIANELAIAEKAIKTSGVFTSGGLKISTEGELDEYKKIAQKALELLEKRDLIA